MATLDYLKRSLRESAAATSPHTKPLSDTQYDAGFDTLIQGSGWVTYKDFVIPQLAKLLDTLSKTRTKISVLEIGPGPKSVLEHLQGKQKEVIKRYAVFEPNGLFATSLRERFRDVSVLPLRFLQSLPDIHRVPFAASTSTADAYNKTSVDDEKFDMILFCHSMYGMEPKRAFIERALGMLEVGGMVVVFHRDTLRFDGLIGHQTASFPAGVTSVKDDDVMLDSFAHFVAGFTMQEAVDNRAIRVKWRKICRDLGRRQENQPNQLFFSSPNVMVAFTKHATALPELTALVPSGDRAVKNREARLHNPAAVVRPTDVSHIQHCVRWAIQHKATLTVVGGGHSGQCLWPNTVAVDMSAFDQVHILTAGEVEEQSGTLVIAEAGSKSGDVIQKAMAAGVTVPLGARPSVGAGLWLQGGIGHLARQHGLTCDSIVGAVVISVETAQILCIGDVPSQHQPAEAVRPDNEADLLWAIKGAGTNLGIVLSVTFKAYKAPTYLVRDWVFPLSDAAETQSLLSDLNHFATRKLPTNCSVDAYLYWDADKLHLGVTMFESSTAKPPVFETCTPVALGPEISSKAVNSVELFETEMYMSKMHGGHSGGKTSSFKRCVFLQNMGTVTIVDKMVEAIKTRPSPLCYLHLLHGGGAVAKVKDYDTAFGCRNWNFACVITGVWPRDQDESDVARAAVQWVYKIAGDLLPWSSGAYGADLGPDPRDAALATEAFGSNAMRLASIKHESDPHNILANACPLPKAPADPKLIILVTGEYGAGKDYCATIWALVLGTYDDLAVRVVSISDATKREYADATGADLSLLLHDRAYKEQHRPALTAFYQDQVRQRPKLPQDHFLSLVRDTTGVKVLIITGMRDEAPIATFSHLVSSSKMIEVRVKAKPKTLKTRRGDHISHGYNDDDDLLDYCPDLVFQNDEPGGIGAEEFAKEYLRPYVCYEREALVRMIRSVPDFPRPGINYRHVLGICETPGGLVLCKALFKHRLDSRQTEVDKLVCCEASGFLLAALLPMHTRASLVLIRQAGKIPPPTISGTKSPSFISSSSPSSSGNEKIEMSRDAISKGDRVLVVDDVLATGNTLCGVLELLVKAGAKPEDINVIVIAEFPFHRGRQLLRERGFGNVRIQNLLVYGGA